MNLSKSKVTIIIVVLLVLFFALSLLFRVALPYDSIFTGDWIKFSSNDAYYHMRFVDNLVNNFPHVTDFDPYYIYPGGGTSAGGVHFFDYLLAIIVMIIGLGAPTQHTINVVGAYFPAVLAALTVIPVFFIGKALFNRWVGVLAAFLVAIMPGEFMGRSILAFTDNHVAETLFSTVTMLFLILAIKAAGTREDGQGPLTFTHLIKGDRKVLTRPLVYSLLAGIFLGIYLITWLGALLFVFITAVYFILQFIINHLRKKSTDHLGIVGFVVFLIALIIFIPISPNNNLSLALVAAVFIPPILAGISRLISSRGLNKGYYPLSLIVVGAAFVGIFYAVDREVIGALWSNFKFIFLPGGGSTAVTTMEMQPFLSPQGSFDPAVAWGNFTTSFFLVKGWPIPGFGLISFIVLIWLSVKQRGEKEYLSVFVIWTLVILIATLVQRRFAYYLVINMALLTAYISWQLIWLAGLKKLTERQDRGSEADKEKDPKAKKKKQKGPDISTIYLNTILAVVVIVPLISFWNVTKSKEIADSAAFVPSNGWQESLSWMKDNTPDPLGDPDAYYKFYDLDYQYPDSAYGVTAWWDYGYWISRTAHRLPSANPAQDPNAIRRVANLFLSSDESEAESLMTEMDSSYIMADFALITNKYWAVIDWAEQNQDDYIRTYYVQEKDYLKPWNVFLTPEYYRSLLVRLYNFDGKAQKGENPIVVTYQEVEKNGIIHKVVTNSQQYASYQEAQDFITSQTSGNYDIVGGNWFVSPIPLEPVTDFKLVYSSMYSIMYAQNAMVPEIKIFEYLK